MPSRPSQAYISHISCRIAAGQAPATGGLRARLDAAATILTELGGVVEVVEGKDGSLALRGFSCPLADAVRAHPATCRAAESLVASVVGVPVRERCDKGARPQCCFEVER